MKKILVLVLIVMLIFTCGCESLQQPLETPEETERPSKTEAPTPTKEPTPTIEVEESESVPVTDTDLAGIYEGDQYINDALGFSVTIPEEWIFATAEEIETVFGQAQGAMEDVVELPDNSQLFLMLCSEQQLMTATENPNINIAISNQYVGFSKSMYDLLLVQMQSLYDEMYTQMGAKSVSVTGEPSVIINNTDYMSFSIVSDFTTTFMYQDQYFILLGDYMLMITQTYYNTEQKDTMDAFMQDIVYNPEP